MNVSTWFRNHDLSLEKAGIITLASESYSTNSNPLAVTLRDFGNAQGATTLFVDGGDPSKGQPFHNVDARIYHQEKLGIPNVMEKVDDWFKNHPIVFSYAVDRYTRPFLLKLTPSAHKFVICDVIRIYKCADAGTLSEVLSTAASFTDLVSGLNTSTDANGKGYAVDELVARTPMSVKPGTVPGFRKRNMDVGALLDNALLSE